jgi:hypothetical protein
MEDIETTRERRQERHRERDAARLMRRLRPTVLALEGRELLSTIWTVNSTGDAGTGSGNSGDLRYCIAGADSTSGDNTINFSVSGTITLSGSQLELKNTSGDASQTIEIDGPGASVLSISGNKASGVFQIDSGVTASISGLTITGGKAEFGGGLNNHGTSTLSNCTVSGNSAARGGGLNNYAKATLTDCTVSGNSGGGLDNFGSATLTDCTVSRNSATLGGGVHNNKEGTAALSNCTVSGNSASIAGGGLYNDGTAKLTNCTVSGNSAGSGGGLYSDGLAKLTNCTVSANSAGNGGGLYNDSEAILTNTIIAGNTTLPNGAGAASDISSEFANVSGSYNLIGTGGSGGLSNNDGNHNQVGVANPGLAPLGDYGGPTETMALMPKSPAIDKGNATITGVTLPPTDQRGALRGSRGLNAGDTPDIGAFEASSSYLVTTAADSKCVGTVRTAFDWANVSTNNNPANLSPNPAAPNTIVFDTSGAFSTPQTITLSPSLGTLNLTDTMTAEAIDGPGAPIVKVSGGDQVQVLSVGPGVTATIVGLTIAHGSAGNGGGIDNQGTLTLRGSAVSNNSCLGGGSGGGIFNDGTLTLFNSTISDNSGDFGGGIEDYQGTMTLTNCTLSENSANSGGGLLNYYGPVTLTNCTVSNNSAAIGGGGIDNSFDGGSATVTLANTIVAGNSLTGSGGSGSDVNAAFVSMGYNVIGKTSGSTNTWLTSDVLNVSPILAPLGDYGGPTQTMALLPGSPAIGTGNPALAVDPTTKKALTADQRGYQPASMADIGAFQDLGFTLTAVTTGSNPSTPQTATVNQAFTNPLAVIVSANNTSQFTNPVAGGTVTYTVNPAGYGASAALSAGTATISGTQANVTATANTVAGAYTITASAAGASSGDFSLTNNPGAVASVSVDSGSGQSATVGQPFTNLLFVQVFDTYGNLVPGANVTFAAPGSGASASLSQSSVVTAYDGGASVTATANTVAGTYTVTASAGASSGNFSLTNDPGAAASVTVVSGAGQAATVGQPFTSLLVAQVSDAYGNLVPGISVTFAAPVSGASATLVPSSATTGSNGQASVTVAANTVAGGPYFVFATTNGAFGAANFGLTNTPGTIDHLHIQTEPPPTATAGQPFNPQPVVFIEDQYGNLLTSDFTTQVIASLASGTGPLQGTTTVTAVGGMAVFSNLADNQIETISLAFNTNSALRPVTSGNIVVGQGPPVGLVIHTQPAPTATAGKAFDTQPVVYVVDQFGRLETGDSTTEVTAALRTGSGPLLGTTTVTVSGGIATFKNLADDKAEIITLMFAGVPLHSVVSNSIKVSPAPASQFRISAPATMPPNTAFTITVTAYDPYGNVATGYRGTVRFTSGDKLATLPGNYTFTASDGGVHTFGNAVKLKTSGMQTIAARDMTNPLITSSASVQVSSGSPDLVLSHVAVGGDGVRPLVKLPGTRAQPKGLVFLSRPLVAASAARARTLAQPAELLDRALESLI